MAEVGETERLKGNEAFGREAWGEAIEAYTQSIALARDDKRVYSNRSAARLRMAENAESSSQKEELLKGAVEDAEKVIALDSYWAKGYYRRGMALESLNRTEEAIESYMAGLHLNPQDAEQLLHASPALRKIVEERAAQMSGSTPTGSGANEASSSPQESDVPLNEPVRAKENTAVASEDNEAEVLRAEGNNAFKRRDWDQAIRSYSEALNVLQSDGQQLDKRIFSNRSAAYLAKANETESSITYQFAVEDAEMCVQIDPDWPKSWYRLGHALAGADRLDEAIEKLQEGVRRNPDDAELGKALEQMLHSQKEIKAGNKPRKMEPPFGNGEPDAEKPRTGKVVETKLYDTLGLKPTATAAEIKKAYLLLAKETHPDKNKDDPNATEMFQAIGYAYQVLSNPETRDTYDKYGTSGLENVGETVDPSDLFAMMFGSDRFDPFLGELQLTSMAAQTDEEGNPPSNERLAEIQEDRIAKLVTNLIGILQIYVDGHHRQFLDWAKSEAKDLREPNFGEPMLFVVGQTYGRHANIALGKQQFLGLPGYWRQFNNSRHKFGTRWSATASFITFISQQQQLETQVQKAEKEGKSLPEEQQQKMAADVAVGFLELAWKKTIMDIVYTLDEVCHRVLSGKDLKADEAEASGKKKHTHFDWKGKIFGARAEPPKEGTAARGKAEILTARAIALKNLGEVFAESGSMDIPKDIQSPFQTAASEEVH